MVAAGFICPFCCVVYEAVVEGLNWATRVARVGKMDGCSLHLVNEYWRPVEGGM